LDAKIDPLTSQKNSRLQNQTALLSISVARQSSQNVTISNPNALRLVLKIKFVSEKTSEKNPTPSLKKSPRKTLSRSPKKFSKNFLKES
jgi:hypothetical protein